MKEKKYKWAVKTESKGSVQWLGLAFCDSREQARWSKRHQKAVWNMCSTVKVTMHKCVVTPQGAILVGKKVVY